MAMGSGDLGRDEIAQQLALSEARYRSFICANPEGIWRFECEQPVSIKLPEHEQIDAFYRFNYLAECNDAMARMYGYEAPSELVGKRLGDLLIRSDPKNDEFHRAFILSGYRLTNAESCERDRSGKARFFLNNLIGIIENDRLVRIWGTQREITELIEPLEALRQSERALRESEQRFSLFMQHLPGAAFIRDAAGRILYVNAGQNHVLGWKDDQWKGKNSAELFPPDVAAQFEAHDRQVLATGKPLQVIEGVPLADGYHQYLVSKFPLATGPGVEPLIGGIAIDVTDLRRAEEIARYQQTLLESVNEVSLDGVLVVSPQGKWLSFNRRFIEMWGITQDIVGSGSDAQAITAVQDQLKDPDDFRQRIAYLNEHPGEKAVGDRIELKDGRIFSRNSAPVQAADGTHYGRVWFFHDRTEEELDRHRLRKIASELTLSEQRERRRIARMLHDDIVQILAMSQMKLHAIEGAVKDPAAIAEVHRLIDDALARSRLLTVELSPPILHERGFVAAVQWLAKRTGPRAGIDIAFSDDGQPKPLDEQSSVLLFQAVQELLSDMVKHSKATRGEVSLRRSDQTIQIIVQDNGIGFDRETLRRRQEECDAFGLFSIEERLRFLGGAMKWDSSPGAGAKFTLTAPLSKSND